MNLRLRSLVEPAIKVLDEVESLLKRQRQEKIEYNWAAKKDLSKIQSSLLSDDSYKKFQVILCPHIEEQGTKQKIENTVKALLDGNKKSNSSEWRMSLCVVKLAIQVRLG